MKKITSILTLVGFLLLYTSCGKNDAFFQGEFPNEGPALLEKAIEDEVTVGIAAGYSINGIIQWEAGKGYSDDSNNINFTSSTLTRIASITKPMTAVAIMQLYERGKLDLDAAIQTYLPAFPVKAEGKITVRQLLNHAAGIDAYKNSSEQENKKDYANLSAAIDLFKDRSLVATPGTEFNYTTYGYVVLGRVIEAVSGQSYEAYMQTNIWDKVGMPNTGVEYAAQNYPNQSKLYHRNSRGKIKAADRTNLSDRVPGGGLHSCVTDILKFGDAIMNHTLISEATLEMMITDTGLKTEGNGYGFGFGWYLYGENPKHGNVFGHTGAQTGASTVLFLLPERQTSVVVLGNTSGAFDEIFTTGVLLFDIALGE